MRYSLFCVAVAGLLASTTAYAENEAAPAAAASASAPVIKVGSTLRSAEGSRIGTIQRQLKDENGAPTTEIGRDTSELQSLMRISYAVFCLKKKIKQNTTKKSTIINTILKISNLQLDLICN